MITHAGPIRTREALGSLAEPRSAARCTAKDCEENTSERKPYCHRHVFLMPYVHDMPHMRAARGERVEISPQDRAEVMDAARRHRGANGGRYGARRCKSCGKRWEPTLWLHRHCDACRAGMRRVGRFGGYP